MIIEGGPFYAYDSKDFPEWLKVAVAALPVICIHEDAPRGSFSDYKLPFRLKQAGFKSGLQVYAERGKSNFPIPELEIKVGDWLFVSHPPGMGLTTPDDNPERDMVEIDCFDSPPRALGFRFSAPMRYHIGVYRGRSSRETAAFVVVVS